MESQREEDAACWTLLFSACSRGVLRALAERPFLSFLDAACDTQVEDQGSLSHDLDKELPVSIRHRFLLEEPSQPKSAPSRQR